MDGIKYRDSAQLVRDLEKYGSIHVECNPQQSEKLRRQVEHMLGYQNTAYVTASDMGYERQSVGEYLKFFKAIYGSEESVAAVAEGFCLSGLAGKKVWHLNSGERMQLQLARVSMSQSRCFFIEEPLFHLDSYTMKRVVAWMEEASEAGIHFITTNSSLKYALFMPGKAFYQDENAFCEVEMDEKSESDEEKEMAVLKIPAKSGDATLLFDPKDIDYIESLNRNNYVTVRGSAFPVQYTMDELEQMLKKSGFFRCHRSYIVNVQKVQRLERMTKNSYVLILNDKSESQVPLSKGRIEEMKNTYGW